MDQNYTAEEVAVAARLFTEAKEKDHCNSDLDWEIAENAEWCNKEINKLFTKYLFVRGTGQHEIADAMDETIIRLTGWSFDTYLVNTFLRSQSDYDPIDDIIKESEATGEY